MALRKRTARLVVAALACLVAPAASATTITLVHVTDTHSHLDGEGPRNAAMLAPDGGLMRAASIVGDVRSAHPDALLVHAGDLFQEDVYFEPTLGTVEMEMLASLGLDIVQAVGNHELRLGPAALGQVLSNFSPLLAANLDVSGAPSLKDRVLARVVKSVNGARVGFFGLVTYDAAELLDDGSGELLAVDEDYAGVAAVQVAALRGEQVDAVVLVSHLGRDVDEALIGKVGGIDLVIGGHDHAVVSERVKDPQGRNVPIVHAGAFYDWVGITSLEVDGHTVTACHTELLRVGPGVPRAPALQGELELVQAGIDERYGEELFRTPIATALLDVAMDVPDRSPLRDSPVGDLVADALRTAGHTEIGLTTAGFLTVGLSHGPLVRQDAYRIVGDGFDRTGAGLGFQLYTLTLPGDLLAGALQYALGQGGDYAPEVSGLRIAYDSTNPAAPPVLLVQGHPIRATSTYTLTLNEGVLFGLAGLLQRPDLVESAESLGMTEYEAVRDWIAQRKVILYFSTGRVLDVGKL